MYTILRDQRVPTICLDCQSEHASTLSATPIFALHILETGKMYVIAFSKPLRTTRSTSSFRYVLTVCLHSILNYSLRSTCEQEWQHRFAN